MRRTVTSRLLGVASVASASLHPLSGAELPRHCPFWSMEGLQGQGSLEGQVEAGTVTVPRLPWPQVLSVHSLWS